MKIYQKYLFRLLGLSSIAVASLLVCAVWMVQILRYMETVLKTTDSDSLLVLGKLAIFMAPNLITLLSPVAAAIGCLMVIHKLIEDREIVALWAGGVSNANILSVVRRLGLCLFFGCLVLQSYVAPSFVRKFRDLEHTLHQTVSLSFIQEGVFQQFGTVTLFVGQKFHNQLINLMVFVEDQKQPSFILLADRGLIFKEHGIPKIVLENGMRQEQRPQNKGIISMLHFDRAIVDVGQPEEQEASLSHKPSEQYLWELLLPEYFDVSEHDTRPILAQDLRMKEIHLRLLSCALGYVLPLLVVSILLSRGFQRRDAGRRLMLAMAAILTVQILVLVAANSYNTLAIYCVYGLLAFILITISRSMSNPQLTGSLE